MHADKLLQESFLYTCAHLLMNAPGLERAALCATRQQAGLGPLIDDAAVSGLRSTCLRLSKGTLLPDSTTSSMTLLRLGEPGHQRTTRHVLRSMPNRNSRQCIRPAPFTKAVAGYSE